MTVHRGRGWRLAPSLIALEHEANRLAPRRSQASDGSIGDARHRSNRGSDHNPKWGWVHALDLTHDPRGGFDAHAWGRRIAARRDSRVDYLISNGQIWNAYTGWRRYSGSNPHRTHLHVSVHKSAWARNNLAPWLSGVPAGPPVPSRPPTSKPSTMPTEEEDDVTVLVRSDPKQGGDGAVIAVSGRFYTVVKSEDYQFMQYITGGADAVRQVNRANFNHFLSTHVDAQNVNLAAFYSKAAAG